MYMFRASGCGAIPQPDCVPKVQGGKRSAWPWIFKRSIMLAQSAIVMVSRAGPLIRILYRGVNQGSTT